jgi:hypothetical protein
MSREMLRPSKRSVSIAQRILSGGSSYLRKDFSQPGAHNISIILYQAFEKGRIYLDNRKEYAVFVQVVLRSVD